MSSISSRNIAGAALTAGLVAGVADGVAAIVKFLLDGKKNPELIFKYIASAVMGGSAYQSGRSGWMIGAGIFLHLLIAVIFSFLYFLLYPRLAFLRKNIGVSSIIYGLFLWTVMNLVVVPASRIGRFPVWNSQVFIQMAILVVAIGLPVSWMAKNFYEKKTAS